ncbi:MAG TPA: alpha/beta fold hydrolase [Solirubrobacteraceae bacterium]|nr:alpha/beta fold hydrolase [Solirubrobacteraceae bacterium]
MDTTTSQTARSSHQEPGLRLAARSGLEVMLSDAVVEGGGVGRFIKPRAAGRTIAGLARHPRRAVSDVGSFGSELARVATGRSAARPGKGDRRFADRAWQDNWLLRRVMQSYLATCQAVDRLISDAGLDWQTERQARFAASNVLDALAPTNFPWSNPAVLKESIDAGGANLVRGGRHFLHDVTRPPHLPASVDVTKFEVGGNLAVTPGSVVSRNEVFELIQYRPATDEVYEVPLLFVPPTINKYYILDISPGRSMIEWLLEQQQQVFTISWRNPDAAQGHFDLDTYAQAVLEARDAVAEITGQHAVNVNAACSGGIITACALGHLAAIGEQDKVATLTMMVCALDQARMGTAGAVASKELAAAAVAESARKGYVDGRALAGVFAWLRPNDLVWNYVVNNYLLGKDPPAFDILYWNQDTVRLAAGLHRDFIRIALGNGFTQPGTVEVLGTPVDLGAIAVDSYAIAGLNDHIVPWQNAYHSAQLLGGTKRFVLSTSGHIQALVNPPGAAGSESRASYRVTDDPADVPENWVANADIRRGSWWPDYRNWLTQRAGELMPAPKTLGSRKHKATAKAPGSYVHAG